MHILMLTELHPLLCALLFFLFFLSVTLNLFLPTRSESPSSQHQPQPHVSSATAQTLRDRRSCSQSPSPSPQPEDRESQGMATDQPPASPLSTATTPGYGSTTTSVSSEASTVKPEIQKDSDSDFCELNLLDDVEIEDQLVFKKEVCSWDYSFFFLCTRKFFLKI